MQDTKERWIKIAIISNHIPQELLELKEKMGGYYQVDLIGLGYRTEQVNAEFLQQYDLVITIGRTVPRCLAMGVPVYVYDYLGGPGYLTEANFSLAERNNFSGRGFEKKTSDELLKEIKEGYARQESGCRSGRRSLRWIISMPAGLMRCMKN